MAKGLSVFSSTAYGYIKQRSQKSIMSSGIFHHQSFCRQKSSSIPFYGEPTKINNVPALTTAQKIGIALYSASSALADPARADSVAALGEVTGAVALRAIYHRMKTDPTGQRILQDKPVVDLSSLDLAVLRSGPTNTIRNDGTTGTTATFGQAYASFMETHGFDPEERSRVKFIDDPELAYVMLRYRQIHDFTHVLCNLPPNVLGELALKWVELLQTNLPVTTLSVLFGPRRLNSKERQLYETVYKPWAIHTGTKADFFMNVYFEELFDQDLETVRETLNIKPAPTLDMSDSLY
jgi:ubiquinone biosynthesis protein COQ4